MMPVRTNGDLPLRLRHFRQAVGRAVAEVDEGPLDRAVGRHGERSGRDRAAGTPPARAPRPPQHASASRRQRIALQRHRHAAVAQLLRRPLLGARAGGGAGRTSADAVGRAHAGRRPSRSRRGLSRAAARRRPRETEGKRIEMPAFAHGNVAPASSPAVPQASRLRNRGRRDAAPTAAGTAARPLGSGTARRCSRGSCGR